MSLGNGSSDMRAERLATRALDLSEEVRGRLHVVEQTQIAERAHQVSLLADLRALREEMRTVLAAQVSDVSQRLLGVEYALEQQGRVLMEILEAVKGE